MAVKPIPEGFRTLTPYLMLNNAAEAIEWYKKALGAEEKYSMKGPNGSVVHAEIRIGDSFLMLADESPMNSGVRSPKTVGVATGGLCVYVEDADALYNRAVSAGAQVLRPIADQFYGDRSGSVVDPFGHHWTIATHKEDVSPAEIERRVRAFHSQQGAGAD